MTNMTKSIDSHDNPQRRPDGRADPWANRTIVLVGLMGAGKSCVGRRLAARIGRPFVDGDAEIELAAGCTVAEIFDRLGEPLFRERERSVMARLLDGPPSVLASGGGAFVDPETRRLIAAKGISVWLRAELDVLVKRTAGRDHRPLLRSGDPREALSRLMEKRYPIYAEADVTVDTADQPADATVDQVLAALQTLSAPAAQPVAVS